ncbi:MAG TPA: hypothetical protein PLL09_11160 [Flavobacterium sp.]|uniref:hypothetical protein n=1 Tax=unclassified Flavobacterium TaxID=196869 RepID=UPI0025BBDCA6|nr:MULTISPECIES: hypothetical protein [unclassified Flavobacterium]HRE78370.1 hypothetical protein [Flavobacterium sp.]
MLLVSKYTIIFFGLFFFFAGGVMLFNPTKFRNWVSMAGSTNFINYTEITLRLIPAAAMFYYAEESKFTLVFKIFGGFMMITSLVLYFVPRRYHHQLSVKFANFLKPLYFQLISPLAFLIGLFILYSVM